MMREKLQKKTNTDWYRYQERLVWLCSYYMPDFQLVLNGMIGLLPFRN